VVNVILPVRMKTYKQAFSRTGSCIQKYSGSNPQSEHFDDFMLFLLLGREPLAGAADHNLPGEARKFISDRDTCDHFHGEPYEGR
jgi:hypothetical protein